MDNARQHQQTLFPRPEPLDEDSPSSPHVPQSEINGDGRQGSYASRVEASRELLAADAAILEAVPVKAPGSPTARALAGDAREIPLADKSIDLVVTSPPYWKKRDYGLEGQIGQEPTADEYVDGLLDCLREWRRLLRPTGSVFLNIGDTYHRRSLANIPARVELAAADDGWLIRNRIVWTKEGGMPEPARNRLANRHEFIIHMTLKGTYYYDLFGYSETYGHGNGANPGDVWQFNPARHMGDHLAPFPTEIAERAIRLACPIELCSECGEPRQRVVQRTMRLDERRVQARRALVLAREGGLTPAHIAAIQATGISDAGKALIYQTGTGRNSAEVQRLAAEAKAVLGGYFREFTFALRETVGWTDCECGADYARGVVLDPFMGTGTTLSMATRLGRDAIGVDLAPAAVASDLVS